MGSFALSVLVMALAAASAAAQGVNPNEAVQVSLEASKDAAIPGDQLALAIVLDHADHFHTWPNEPVIPEALGSDFPAIATTAELVTRPDGVSHVGPIQWPEPEAIEVNFLGDEPTDLMSYAGRAVAYLPVIIAQDAEPGQRTFEVQVRYQACDDQSCYRPMSPTVSTTVEIVPAGSEQAGGGQRGELFADFDPSVFAAMQSGEVDADGGGAGQADGNGAAADEATSAPPATQRNFFGIPVPRGEGLVGILMLALLSAVGGFILNLTPCVLPVIPIKVMTISQHAGSPGRSLVLGLWMATGVVAFWLGLGLPVAFVSTVTDPSRIFGFWWVTLGIGLLIALMGVGIMGLFSINLPKVAYMVNPKADTAGGSFMFGVMTAVLGLPCFGFVAGALLAGAATLPPLVILVIFASLGVGMAAPYLVLSAKPGWVEKLPRTGPASELVKQVMGFLLLAAAAYFIGSGLIALVADRPWIARQLHWWTVAIFVAIAGLWLIVRTFQITGRPVPRAAFTLLAMAIGAATFAYVIDSTAKARENYQERAAAIAAAEGEGELVTTAWINYNPRLLERAREEGYVVVMDFTAEWCLNCKALKAAVLEREPVRSALRTDDVISMKVDLTSTSAPGWGKLQELGETGIPLLVVYGPGLEDRWQSNAYTSGQVMAALERARADRDVAGSEPDASEDSHVAAR